MTLGIIGEYLGRIYDEVRQIRDGGGNGSIIGRNTFQRPREGLAPQIASAARHPD